MKIELLTFASPRTDWLNDFSEKYQKKISGFLPFSLTTLKSANKGREQAEAKKKTENEALLKKIDSSAWVIAFDEKGKEFQSRAFSDQLVKGMESGCSKVQFVLGGAYGLDDTVRGKARAVWSLSPLTMSHQVAQVVAMEQIYRALTIWRGIPYHND